MDWLQIILLALVQGVTEFLPVSSSAHLVLPAQLTDWPDQGLAFDVGVHFGTLIAVLLYFRQELTRMAVSTAQWPITKVYDEHLDWVLKLALATVPVTIVGFVAKDFVAENLRTVSVIATTTIVFALALWWADRKASTGETLSWMVATLIGAAQILALVPGTSRSGITITAALLLGLNRVSAARFSFLLAIPTIAGAQLLLSLDLLDQAQQTPWLELLTASILAGLAAYVCIHYFIALVEKTGMLPYVIYRLLLGLILFVFFV